MEETQFYQSIWDQLPPALQNSAIRMTGSEVAWKKNDAMLAVDAFSDHRIGVNGIEFFFFNGVNEPLQATTHIFSCNRSGAETWREYVSRSCAGAKRFIVDVYNEQRSLYRGTPVFNIWAASEFE